MTGAWGGELQPHFGKLMRKLIGALRELDEGNSPSSMETNQPRTHVQYGYADAGSRALPDLSRIELSENLIINLRLDPSIQVAIARFTLSPLRIEPDRHSLERTNWGIPMSYGITG
jgi:hypothetical protein